MIFLIIVHNNEVVKLYDECLTFDTAVRHAVEHLNLNEDEVEQLYLKNYVIVNNDGCTTEFYIGKVEDVKY